MDQRRFLWWHEAALSVLGLWPPQGISGVSFGVYWVYRILFLFVFCFAFNAFEIAGFFDIYNDLQAVASNLCWSLMHFTVCLKIGLFFAKITELKRICDRLRTSVFLPNQERSPGEPEVVAIAVKMSVGYLLVYYSMTVVILANCFIAPLYREKPLETLNANPADSKPEPPQNPLPYYTYVFCNALKSPCYEIAYIYQTLSTLICSLVLIHCDNLYLFIVMFCTSQLRILNASLETVIRRAARNCPKQRWKEYAGLRTKRNDVVDRESFRLGANCVKHHHAILEVLDELEGIYNLVILIQFLSHLVQLCFQMFIVSEISLLSFDGLSMLAFVVAMVIEVYVYCQCGNEIEIESSKISQSAYNAQWTSSSEPVKRMLLIIMLRAQRPVEFTVGKFVKLSLRTLVSVVQGSFSYFMVLRKMQ
ncbi:odorant receptor 10-like isoform X1 [Neodiprion pinetum]|uniref:odorant receptor 10-like isoform X1 n=1 Tax=Neodiprion pinetum TaxID=441929 RepID=UPI001EDD1FF4|nr:odorant receptor Or2-like [Neodiprion pinetum]